MADLTFEPYSTRIHWSAPAGFDHWQEMLSEFMQALAINCTKIGTVIGHIKALSLFEGQKFICLSAIDRNHPITLEGTVPAGLKQLDLSLNILVFGFSHDLLAQIAARIADEVSVKWHVKAEIQPEPEKHPPHASAGYN